ncbi:hypothetical protein [Escherichia coli]
MFSKLAQCSIKAMF